MAEASSQARKLGLREGIRLAFTHAPDGWGLQDAPLGLVDAGSDEPADVVIAFFSRADDLAPRLPALAERIFPAGALWIAWPRRASGHTSDITDTVVREAALVFGLVDTKVAAIDEDWSGLKCVWRVGNRVR